MVGTAGITGDVFAGEYQPSGAWPVQRWDNDE